MTEGSMVDFELLRLGPIEVETATRTATLGDGQELALTRLEFDVFALLVRAQGAPVRRAVLFDAVWGRSNDVSDHAMETLMSVLRAKLGPARGMIRTVRKVGYALVPEHGEVTRKKA
jgi:two-component system phosphate regulon response regulator PhoB